MFGDNLARRGDVVVVTINHRLNLFGYFHLGDLGGEKYAASGNAGMLDLVAGLEWVRDNIERFGGDPANVTIFGESGGGAKVSTLLAMPAAKGLFSHAIIQSGPGLRVNTRDDSGVLTQAMLTELAVSPSHIDDLQTIPASRLLAAMRKVQPRPVPGRGGFGPVLDEKILPAHPFDPQASAISAHVPILVGCNSHEQTFFSLTDEPAFNLSDVELQQRVVAMVGGTKPAGLSILTSKAIPVRAQVNYFS